VLRKFFLGLIISGLIFGCSNPTNTGNGIPNHPIPNSQITVYGNVQVQIPSTTGKSVYSASCFLSYQNGTGDDTVFNSAIVEVNGMPLTQQFGSGMFYGSGLLLSTGDSVVFLLKHPTIGTVRQMLHVPPSITQCIVQPESPKSGVANVDTTYSLAWGTGGVDASYYMISAACYDSLKDVASTYSTTTSVNTFTFPSKIFRNGTGGLYPYVDLKILPFEAISFPGYSRGSQFSVSSAAFKEYSNL